MTKRLRAPYKRRITKPRPAPALSTAIPFIRTFPSGETRLHEIDRGPELYSLACSFIAQGGRYLTRINQEGHVEVIAVLCRDGESDDAQAVAGGECDNGPELLDMVDKIVRLSVEGIDLVQ